MGNIKNALVIYPNQLFDTKLLPKADVIYVVEEPLFFCTDDDRKLKFHKQKMVLHRASMRRYIEELLWQQDLNVEYLELSDIKDRGDVLVKAQKDGAEQVMIFDPCDHLLEAQLKTTIEKRLDNPFELKVLPNPSFMLKAGEAREYFAKGSKHRFSEFYQWQRERFNVLIDKNYKPVNGSWMFNSRKVSKTTIGSTPPGFKAYGDNQYVHQAKDWVNHHFDDNPGTTDNFFWPTDHKEAAGWLEDFLDSRFGNFADYADSLDNNSVILYHSGISAMLNIGLLTPAQVINETLKYATKNPVSMENLEGFIRRILGWREYIRALYLTNLIETPKDKEAKPISAKLICGDTGLPPYDELVKKVNQHGYASNNERMMIAGNMMLLTESHPIEIYKWFLSMFIDAYDWSVQPNVFSMTSFNDMGGMVNKTYISDSEYLLSTSNYQKDLWCDVWDGLFWAYIDKHRVVLANHPATAHLVKHLEKITPEHRRIIGYRAQDFIASLN